jgi:hypothetical protein
MTRKLHLFYLPFAIVLMSFGFSLVAFGQSEEIPMAPRIDIVETLREEIDESKEKVVDVAEDKARGFIKSISDFFVERIGVNLIEGAKLLGSFFIWAFESLAKFVRWILTLF